MKKRGSCGGSRRDTRLVQELAWTLPRGPELVDVGGNFTTAESESDQAGGLAEFAEVSHGSSGSWRARLWSG